MRTQRASSRAHNKNNKPVKSPTSRTGSAHSNKFHSLQLTLPTALFKTHASHHPLTTRTTQGSKTLPRGTSGIPANLKKAPRSARYPPDLAPYAPNAAKLQAPFLNSAKFQPNQAGLTSSTINIMDCYRHVQHGGGGSGSEQLTQNASNTAKFGHGDRHSDTHSTYTQSDSSDSW